MHKQTFLPTSTYFFVSISQILGANDVLFEPWFINVELGLGLGLYETKGILIPKGQLANLTQKLGIVVDKSIVMTDIVGDKVGEFRISPVPCCGDISFVLPFKNQSVSSVGGMFLCFIYIILLKIQESP